MELIPENLNGVVVFSIHNSCGANKNICGNCADFAVAIHNWILNTEVRYVIVDLQDEKEICPAFLEEVLQLWKRLKYPFLFAGVMDKAKRVLESYDYMSRGRIYVTPEEAIAALEQSNPGITKVSLAGVEFGQPIAISRPRHSLTVDDPNADVETAD